MEKLEGVEIAKAPIQDLVIKCIKDGDLPPQLSNSISNCAHRGSHDYKTNKDIDTLIAQGVPSTVSSGIAPADAQAENGTIERGNESDSGLEKLLENVQVPVATHGALLPDPPLLHTGDAEIKPDAGILGGSTVGGPPVSGIGNADPPKILPAIANTPLPAAPMAPVQFFEIAPLPENIILEVNDVLPWSALENVEPVT